jgi:hypothetical protein
MQIPKWWLADQKAGNRRKPCMVHDVNGDISISGRQTEAPCAVDTIEVLFYIRMGYSYVSALLVISSQPRPKHRY